MKDKIRFFMAILIAVTVFLMILVLSLFNQQKSLELQFNERKAKLIKENLDLKDKQQSLRNVVEQKKEAMALLEEKRKAIEEQIKDFENEKEAVKEEYTGRIMELEEENASLARRIDDLESKTLSEKLEESLQREENEALRQFLAKVIYNIQVIREGGNIELEPIVVTKTQDGAQAQTAVASAQRNLRDIEEKPSGLTGNIISVDRKYSLVVFDLGRKDGISRGRQCKILKRGDKIATAEIISVRYRVSAAFVYEMEYGYDIRDVEQDDKITVIPE